MALGVKIKLINSVRDLTQCQSQPSALLGEPLCWTDSVWIDEAQQLT